MDLDLAPEHALLRDTIRDFMLTEVAPVIDEHERERRFPIEIVRRIGELGPSRRSRRSSSRRRLEGPPDDRAPATGAATKGSVRVDKSGIRTG